MAPQNVNSNCNKYDSSLGGLINTCYDQQPPSPYFTCNNQLDVTGSLVADRIDLYRTYGSLRNGISQESPWGKQPLDCSLGNYNAPGANQSSLGCAAEAFNYNPINYLFGISDGNGQEGYDSIISLPPAL